jgi:hypothetical protein
MAQATRQVEQDFPAGHPARHDYNPESPEAIEWARTHVAPLGERDFPIDHPKALDTPGNLNHLPITAGADPLNPHREPFTNRTPAQAAGVRQMSEVASQAAKESPVTQPIDAAVVNRMLDTKRQELGRDLLTPEEYQATLRDYHAQRTAGVDQATAELKLSRRDRAISYVMSRGYSVDVATIIVNREGVEPLLKQAGEAPGEE